MAQHSFDVVAEVDRQEVDNALNQASKEIAQRYDFKGSNASISWSGESVEITADTEERVRAALDVFQDKLVKRKVSLKGLDHDEPKPAARGTYRLAISFVSGIPGDKAKAMVAELKKAKLKIQPAIQDDQLRVTGKSKDDLQQAQEILREHDQGLPLRFTNYK